MSEVSHLDDAVSFIPAYVHVIAHNDHFTVASVEPVAQDTDLTTAASAATGSICVPFRFAYRPIHPALHLVRHCQSDRI